MKHFFPSSVMLTPFLVKRYQRDGDQTIADDANVDQASNDITDASKDELSDESQDETA